ncbi:hypothetical protein [Chelatococcus reniformis]|uniref:Transmembrane protein n=1 Tax=Chelatococcus reniformis TaxID=1494448 RepID=A0A916UM07_9HYPH|nr:hypothetical protein [Chelatococcus reniformis]GGC77592.1 hypothetical protein GCM10010994_39870 [Chelatococcus reniformis]
MRAVHLLSFGLLILAFAVLWWWVTYRDVIHYAYLPARDAAVCLVGQTGACSLARALCRGSHPLVAANYWWGTFWIGLAMASLSLTLVRA